MSCFHWALTGEVKGKWARDAIHILFPLSHVRGMMFIAEHWQRMWGMQRESGDYSEISSERERLTFRSISPLADIVGSGEGITSWARKPLLQNYVDR